MLVVQSSEKIAANGSYLEFHDRSVAICRSFAVLLPLTALQSSQAGGRRLLCAKSSYFVIATK